MRALGSVSCLILLHLASSSAQSYWDLALQVVPLKTKTALDLLVTLNADSGPNDVKDLRVALLGARESLDVFSYAYNKSKSVDTWELIRKDMDMGYELLGDFQDLAHSLVEYNDTDVQERREVCLEWLDDIMTNRLIFSYDTYFFSPMDKGLCAHKHLSKLFWGYAGCMPEGRLTGTENMVRLLHSQLTQILDNMTVVMQFEHVYQEPDHTRFHLFRKLIRSTLAVLEMVPGLLPPTTLATTARPSHSRRMLSDPTAITWGTWQKVVQGVGRITALIAGSAGGGGDHADDVGVTDPPECDPMVAVQRFYTLFKGLGQVNNKAFAVDFYTERGMQAEAEAAKADCDKEWLGQVKWMKDVDLEAWVHCLAKSLVGQGATAQAAAA